MCPSVLGIYKIILLFHITGDSTKHTWPKHYTILQYCNHFMCNQLEKLKAARSAYLWLPFLIFSYLSWPEPYWALLDLTRPYWALLGTVENLRQSLSTSS